MKFWPPPNIAISGRQATVLLDLAIAMKRKATPGVPVPYAKGADADVQVLERAGLVERHWLGDRLLGALVTDKGMTLLHNVL